MSKTIFVLFCTFIMTNLALANDYYLNPHPKNCLAWKVSGSTNEDVCYDAGEALQSVWEQADHSDVEDGIDLPYSTSATIHLYQYDSQNVRWNVQPHTSYVRGSDIELSLIERSGLSSADIKLLSVTPDSPQEDFQHGRLLEAALGSLAQATGNQTKNRVVVIFQNPVFSVDHRSTYLADEISDFLSARCRDIGAEPLNDPHGPGILYTRRMPQNSSRSLFNPQMVNVNVSDITGFSCVYSVRQNTPQSFGAY